MEGADVVPTSEPSTVQVQEPRKPQTVLILCGLIASGKSTFAQSLQEHFPNFRRCNQDDLGDRKRVEALARLSLSQGHSICIDRTNFNASQRAYWINIAREFPGTEIWVIVFDTPHEVCAARLQYRTSHPTIKTPEQGLEVLARFSSEFTYPAPQEGYHRIITLKLSDHDSPVWDQSDLASVLQRVRESPLVDHGNHWQQHGQVGHPSFPSNRARGYLPRGGYNDMRGRGWIGRGSGYYNNSPVSNAHHGQYVPRGRGQTTTHTFRGWGVVRESSEGGRGRGGRGNFSSSSRGWRNHDLQLPEGSDGAKE